MIQAYNTIINVQNLYETSSRFKFWIWTICPISDRITFQNSKCKKVQIPQTTMSISIEAVGNEQPFQ